MENIRKFPFLVSEFGIFFIIIFIIILFFIFPQYHPPKLFHSKNLKSFNPNYEPKILFHLTDTHTNTNKGSSLKKNGSYIFLNSFIKYKPDLILSTGDVVDNFIDSTHLFKVGAQRKRDWKEYNETIRKIISKYPVIDVAGNHDLYCVDSAISEYNYFLDYSFIFNRSNVKNDDDFFIKKIKMFNLTFILINDYRFPVPPPPYGIDVHTNKHQLDLIENMLDNLKEKECYILSHYNVDRASLIKSSKGHSFQEIISNKKVAAIFTGHIHPKNVKIIHHGNEGGLEFCSSSPFNNKKAGLITIDNDNLIYHEVYIQNESAIPKFFMSYPVPNEQISSHHIFNLNEFEIRVISYYNNKNIILVVEGDVKGKLKYQMTLKNGAMVFGLKINLPNGNYHIHVFDEKKELCSIHRNFTIGNIFKGNKEYAIHNPRAFIALRFSSIPMIIFLFIIIFPSNINLNNEKIEIIENYIEYKKYKDKNKVKTNLFILYFWLIVLSPFIIRKRFLKLDKYFRNIIFFLSLYPIFLPIYFFDKINGRISFAFNVFIVIGNSIQYENWAMEITYSYYLFIIFPIIFFFSSISYKKIKLIFIKNCIISVFLILNGFLFTFTLLAQSTSFEYLFFSPYFIILFLSALSIIIFSFLKPKKKEEKELDEYEEMIEK